mgnify:CR=1 FL=1|tara:strand:+ start:1206 stop:1346 length:141 start_codon:yes stop_codon:yes gene_type:complete
MINSPYTRNPPPQVKKKKKPTLKQVFPEIKDRKNKKFAKKKAKKTN